MPVLALAVDDPFQPLALFVRSNLPRHARVIHRGHIHKEPSRQRDVAGDACALLADRLLGNLHQYFLSFFQDVADHHRRTRLLSPRTAALHPSATTTTPAPVIAVILRPRCPLESSRTRGTASLGACRQFRLFRRVRLSFLTVLVFLRVAVRLLLVFQFVDDAAGSHRSALERLFFHLLVRIRLVEHFRRMRNIFFLVAFDHFFFECTQWSIAIIRCRTLRHRLRPTHLSFVPALESAVNFGLMSAFKAHRSAGRSLLAMFSLHRALSPDFFVPWGLLLRVSRLFLNPSLLFLSKDERLHATETARASLLRLALLFRFMDLR